MNISKEALREELKYMDEEDKKDWVIESIKEMDKIDFHLVFDAVRERYNNELMEWKNE
jgi:hypothetical protein